ncbi:hypothetical protein ANANG_G00125190 [Anguilla anguilla]|uniref:MADF domain-containing protein n=1 Tax=Anguilla anguilla TaxID=7936 RepID=A0A9D3MG67_ANGAN|nr:hypothetical protein ANANG_G00125190 [Anguilla anguilla]
MAQIHGKRFPQTSVWTSRKCIKKWKNLRDKYVRLRKALARRSGDPGGEKVSAFYLFLAWLAPHIKHRDTESNNDDNITCYKAGSDSTSSTSAVEETPTETVAEENRQPPDIPPSRPPSPSESSTSSSEVNSPVDLTRPLSHLLCPPSHLLSPQAQGWHRRGRGKNRPTCFRSRLPSWRNAGWN